MTSAKQATDALAGEVWGLISEVMYASWPWFMAICREFELFPPQVLAIKTLDEPKRMRDVADWLACDNSNLTGIIDRLEERDLVKRTPDPGDRRVKMLVLTDAGRRLHKEIVARMNQPPPEIAALSDSDLRELRAIMRRTAASGLSE